MNENILIVDDQIENLNFLIDILKDQGYVVRPAKSGKIALQTIEKEMPDLILLDIVMPVIDGYKVCEILKNDERYKEIPIIFLSALDSSFDKVNAFKVGAVDFITKPFNEDEVKIRIETQLKIRRYQKEVEEKKVLELAKKLDEERHLRDLMLLRTERLASLGALSSSIAHEIRQPLQLIKVVSDSMLYSIINDKKFRARHIEIEESIRNISDGVERINYIINCIQEIIKKSEKHKTHKININNLIRKIIKLNLENLRAHNVFYELQLDESIDNLNLSETQFEEVIINLINNSIEALDSVNKENKKILIKTENEKNKIFAYFIDNGPGIKSDVKEKIFNPLFTTKNNPESMGLGLFIVNNILSNNNASIDVLNESSNGTIFRVTFNKENNI